MKQSYRWVLMAKRGWTDVEIGGVHSFEDAKDILRSYFRKNAPERVWIEYSSGGIRWMLDRDGETEGVT